MGRIIGKIKSTIGSGIYFLLSINSLDIIAMTMIGLLSPFTKVAK